VARLQSAVSFFGVAGVDVRAVGGGGGGGSERGI
jgi:hypothetical protein